VVREDGLSRLPPNQSRLQLGCIQEALDVKFLDGED
jgi:hypothetical protein